MTWWSWKGRAKTSSTPPPREPPQRVISNEKAPIPLTLRLPLLAEQTAFCPPPQAREHVRAWMESGSRKQLKKILRARDENEKELKKLRKSEEFQQKENEDWMNEETVDFATDSIRQPPEPWLSTEKCPHIGSTNTRQSVASSRDTLFASGQSSGTIFEGPNSLPTQGISPRERAYPDSKRPPRFNDYRERRASRSLGRCIENRLNNSTEERQRLDGGSSHQCQTIQLDKHVQRSQCSENESSLATANGLSPRETHLRKSFCSKVGTLQSHASCNPVDNQSTSHDACASQVDSGQDRITDSNVPSHKPGTTSSGRGRPRRPVSPLSSDAYSVQPDPHPVSPEALDHEAQDDKPDCPGAANQP